MRRIRSVGCARAATDHATAPPTNSRRLISTSCESGPALAPLVEHARGRAAECSSARPSSASSLLPGAGASSVAAPRNRLSNRSLRISKGRGPNRSNEGLVAHREVRDDVALDRGLQNRPLEPGGIAQMATNDPIRAVKPQPYEQVPPEALDDSGALRVAAGMYVIFAQTSTETAAVLVDDEDSSRRIPGPCRPRRRRPCGEPSTAWEPDRDRPGVAVIEGTPTRQTETSKD